MKSFPPIVGLIALWCAPLIAADFQGADAVLKRLAEQKSKAADAAKPTNPVDELRKKLAGYRAEVATLTPEQAEERWLALFDAFSAIPLEVLNNPRPLQNRLSVQSFLEELPPSADWDALAKAIEARAGGSHELRDVGLRVLAATLRGDDGARKKSFQEMRQRVATAKLEDYEKQNVQQQVEMMEETLAELAGADAERVALFEKRLTQMEKRERPGAGLGDMTTINVPDLVRLVGREKATALLRRVLDLGLTMEVRSEKTRQLAAKLALQSIDQLKAPNWDLVSEVDDAPLYEALAKRFPDSLPQDSLARRRASGVYLISLIVQNRTKEAAKFVTEKEAQFGNGSLLEGEVKDYLVRKGLDRQVRDFLREVLTNDPAHRFWADFIGLSAQLGEADQALAFLREVVARPNLRAEAREATNRVYCTALLAANQVEDGLRILRAVVKEGPRAGARKASDVEAEIRMQYQKVGVQLPAEALTQLSQSAGGQVGSGLMDYGNECLRLARLGRLLARPELITEGVAAAAEATRKAPRTDYERNGLATELAEFFVTTGAGSEAEKLIVDQMLEAAGNEAGNGMGNGVGNLENLTEELTCVYHRTGRHQDVLTLLDQSPYWPGPDLATLTSNEHFGIPMLFAAAKALAVADRKNEARRVVERLLEYKGGYDPAYALLLELGGDDLEARLDALARRDRFQERPLIWKAKLQLDAGRTEEAEKTVRAAIAIDPSDGEEGKGDRMRAYAVLGDVLEKKGDAEQAKVMRGAVEAIRLSENADDWWEAGLLTRAVKMYEEALGHFADAYCIQSRLALRYSELGDSAKAEQHYQRAYELMPESFGRIESHCFGCEGAFSGERAQSIAERVFTRLAEKPGARPQVFYLLGYLREQEKRPADAAAQFQQAVKLDPDYFNAWQHLYGLADGASISQAEIDSAALAILRLDPARRHGGGDFHQVHNLRALWDAVLAAEKALPAPATGPIYPLAAAKVAFERRLKAARDAGQGQFVPDMEMIDQFGNLISDQTQTIRAQFAMHPLLNTLANLLTVFASHR